MSEKHKCHRCYKLIDEAEGVTTLEGMWVCDKDTCRTLDDENEAHVIVSDKLQEIKLLANNAMATAKGHVDLTTYALTWLIEQLEQAQAENERLEELVKVNHKVVVHMTEQNQKLVECLEWYADKENRKKSSLHNSNVKIDNGDKAEEVLVELGIWDDFRVKECVMCGIDINDSEEMEYDEEGAVWCSHCFVKESDTGGVY